MVMGCTVQDLLPARQSSHEEEGNPLPERAQVVDCPELLNDALQLILQIIINDKHRLTLHQILLILEEAYSYSIQKGSLQIDMDFIKWSVKKRVS